MLVAPKPALTSQNPNNGLFYVLGCRPGLSSFRRASRQKYSGSRYNKCTPKYACPWGKINDCQWTDGNDNHPGSETFCFSHCNLQHLSPSCKNSCTCSCRDLTCIGRQINDDNMRDFCMKIVIQEGRVTVNNKNTCDCSMMSCTNKQSCVDVKL